MLKTTQEVLNKLKEIQQRIKDGDIENPFELDDVSDIITAEELSNAVNEGFLTGNEDDGYTLSENANLDYLYQKAVLVEDIKTKDEVIANFSFKTLLNTAGIDDLPSFSADLSLYHELMQAILNSQNDYSLLTPKLSQLGALLDYISQKANEEDQNG